MARLYHQLSELTPAVVSEIYNISGAHPVAGKQPTFVFLIGSPGAGKSSGHGAAIDAGLVQPGNYATVNLDTLLEHLVPYRAGTAMAHHLKQQIASITAYTSKKENLDMFKAYNEGRAALDPVIGAQLNRVRAQWPVPAPIIAQNIIDINDKAIELAINERVDVIYETTFTLTKAGRVTKFDKIFKMADGYRVVVIHVTAPPEDIIARITARQEFGMPAEEFPYYRYVPPKMAVKFVEDNAKAYHQLQTDYAGQVTFLEVQNPLDPARLTPAYHIAPAAQLQRIMTAYGPRATRRRSSSWRPTSFKRLPLNRHSRRSSSGKK
jgi:hypothetical protein